MQLGLVIAGTCVFLIVFGCVALAGAGLLDMFGWGGKR